MISPRAAWLTAFLITFCPHAFPTEDPVQLRYRLPDDPSWEKRPSGKRRIQHPYDQAASRHAIYKKKTNLVNEFTYVGMAISHDGSVGTAGLRNIPFTQCLSDPRAKSACVLTVSKDKVRRDFSFHHEGSNDIVINDMRRFVDFVDGPEHITISYPGEKGTKVSLHF